jgi:hypothetical protein
LGFDYTLSMRSTVLFAMLLVPSLGHAQWEIQESHSTASLRGIYALGNGVAWASGSGGTVLRTTDDGVHWQACAVPPNGEKLDFRGVQGFDAETAIVMSSGKGDLSRLYKTGNGCRTWALLFTNPDPEGFWDGIKFGSRDFGVLLGDPVKNIFVVMLTFDGGLKWEPQTLRATEDINGEGVFAASNSSLSLSSYPGFRTFCTGGRGGPRMVSLSAGPEGDVSDAYEQDGKLHWSRSLYAYRLQTKEPPLQNSGCYSMATALYGTVTVAVGGNYQRPDDRDDTAWTSSAEDPIPPANPFGLGLAKTPPHGYRSAVAYSEKAKTWITVGPNGTDVSTDDGRNWRALRPGVGEAADADRNWNALSLPFVVGAHGRIGKLRADAFVQPGAAKP